MVKRKVRKQQLIHRNVDRRWPKKKGFDWRNPTDPRYPADPTYFLLIFQKKKKEKKSLKKVTKRKEKKFHFLSL